MKVTLIGSHLCPDTLYAINELAATAQLTFREGMEYESMEYAEDGSVVYRTPTGTTAENIILEGADVVSATPAMTQDETTGCLLFWRTALPLWTWRKFWHGSDHILHTKGAYRNQCGTPLLISHLDNSPHLPYLAAMRSPFSATRAPVRPAPRRFR